MARTIPSLTKAPYVLLRERELPEAEQTVYMLMPLDGLQKLDVMSTGAVDYRLALTLGLAGWNNLKDRAGNVVDFSLDKFRELESNDLLELALEIVDRSTFKDEQIKN